MNPIAVAILILTVVFFMAVFCAIERIAEEDERKYVDELRRAGYEVWYLV